jgi:hypothetical protein
LGGVALRGFVVYCLLFVVLLRINFLNLLNALSLSNKISFIATSLSGDIAEKKVYPASTIQPIQPIQLIQLYPANPAISS